MNGLIVETIIIAIVLAPVIVIGGLVDLIRGRHRRKIMDDFMRSFAALAAQHYPGFRKDAESTDQDDIIAWANKMRRVLNLAADDIGNLLNIVETLSGEQFDRSGRKYAETRSRMKLLLSSLSADEQEAIYWILETEHGT